MITRLSLRSHPLQIPWDITVAEVEDWLPVETLAPIEQCVMAVHILCNRFVLCISLDFFSLTSPFALIQLRWPHS